MLSGTVDGRSFYESDAPTDYSDPSSGSIDLTFDVLADGTFHISADVWRYASGAGSKDSFWLVIDGDVANAVTWHIGGSGSDEWNSGNDSPSFSLTTGSHTVSLYGREKDSRIDSGSITLDVE